MNAEKAIVIFRELTIGCTITSSIVFTEPAEVEDAHNSFQIEIQTPLLPGTKKDVEVIRDRYGVIELVNPVRHQSDGRKLGKRVWI